jgi:hypothetical protein
MSLINQKTMKKLRKGPNPNHVDTKLIMKWPTASFFNAKILFQLIAEKIKYFLTPESFFFLNPKIVI